jgi:hypothetical protein
VWASQHLGDEGNPAADELKRKVTQAALNAAAVQTAITVGLQFVPIVGQALSAVLSLVNMFTGRVVKARTKQEMEGVKERLTAHGETRKAEVLAVRDRVALEERMRPQAKGLSGGFSFKGVVQAIEKAAVDTKEQVKDTASSVERSDASEVAQKPSRLKEEATSVWGTVTGRETLTVLREKINAVEEDAKGKIDAQANEAKEIIQSPQGRAALRQKIRDEEVGGGSPFLSAAPWILGSLAVVAIAGTILLRKRR